MTRRATRIVSALALFAAAACTETVTAPAVIDPSAPRHELGGGWTAGSGGVTSDTTTNQDGATTSTEECSAEFSGGWTIGSGVTGPDPCEVS
jgi:hypothetical protein